jgi:RHS repeat-associated protein
MQYFGNTVTVISPENKQKKYTYNALGQVAQVNEQDSNGDLTLVTTYSYNIIGKLNQIVELGQGGQPNQTRTFTYDSLGRMTSETHPESGATTYTYDDNSNVLTKTDARGVVTSYTYDALNRVTVIGYSDATLWSYFYYDQTGSSLISSITYGKGRRTSAWTRNSSGQIVADSVGYSWSFDSSGRVISQVAKIDNITYPVTYNFSSTGCGCTEKGLQSIVYPGNFQVNYTRDDIGRILSINSPPGTMLPDKYVNEIDYGSQSGAISFIKFGNNKRNTFWYDLIGRLEGFSVGSNPYPDASYGISYNSSSQISQIAEYRYLDQSLQYVETSNYSYDNLERLNSIQTSITDDITFYWELSSNLSYDRFGNMLSNQAGTQTTTFNVNAANNRLISYWNGSTHTMSYDASGNVTARGSKNFIYDGANRLINAGNGAGIYRYDAMGRRVKRTFNSGNSSVVSIWGALGELLEDYMTEPAAWWAPKTTKTYYVLAGSRTVAKRIYTSTPDPYTPGYYYNSDLTVWLYRNHLNQVIATEAALGYDNLTLLQQPWHSLQAFSSGGDDQFQGHKDDSESGLHYNLARYYDPKISRWAAADSVTALVYDPQSLNKYAYVRNDPINRVDPDGRDWLDLWWLDSMGIHGIYSYNDALVFQGIMALPGFPEPDPAFIAYQGTVDNGQANLAIQEAAPAATAGCGLEGTQSCIAKGIASTFSGASAMVGNGTEEVGGHWNFNVTIQVSSEDSTKDFDSIYRSVGGFPPPARFGGTGVTLHLENLGTWTLNDDGTWSVSATAHLDLFNPNDGLAGLIGHGVVDFVGGHLIQFFGGNIDPGFCPFH